MYYQHLNASVENLKTPTGLNTNNISYSENYDGINAKSTAEFTRATAYYL
jgi:hypothetical protein